ncbi:hypothetical protein CBM2606_A60163 [Cupriavidus taiwanensis]|nr:hypothetical protein CBM2606_A60163 [Cupriavidus taiwanensis]
MGLAIHAVRRRLDRIRPSLRHDSQMIVWILCRAAKRPHSYGKITGVARPARSDQAGQCCPMLPMAGP